jgi:hypothetical protein
VNGINGKNKRKTKSKQFNPVNYKARVQHGKWEKEKNKIGNSD